MNLKGSDMVIGQAYLPWLVAWYIWRARNNSVCVCVCVCVLSGLVLQKDNASKTKSVAETELVTIREGLGFAKDLGIMKLQIETDAEANCLA